MDYNNLEDLRPQTNAPWENAGMGGFYQGVNFGNYLNDRPIHELLNNVEAVTKAQNLKEFMAHAPTREAEDYLKRNQTMATMQKLPGETALSMGETANKTALLPSELQAGQAKNQGFVNEINQKKFQEHTAMLGAPVEALRNIMEDTNTTDDAKKKNIDSLRENFSMMWKQRFPDEEMPDWILDNDKFSKAVMHANTLASYDPKLGNKLKEIQATGAWHQGVADVRADATVKAAQTRAEAEANKTAADNFTRRAIANANLAFKGANPQNFAQLAHNEIIPGLKDAIKKDNPNLSDEEAHALATQRFMQQYRQQSLQESSQVKEFNKYELDQRERHNKLKSIPGLSLESDEQLEQRLMVEKANWEKSQSFTRSPTPLPSQAPAGQPPAPVAPPASPTPLPVQTTPGPTPAPAVTPTPQPTPAMGAGVAPTVTNAAVPAPQPTPTSLANSYPNTTSASQGAGIPGGGTSMANLIPGTAIEPHVVEARKQLEDEKEIMQAVTKAGHKYEPDKYDYMIDPKTHQLLYKTKDKPKNK